MAITNLTGYKWKPNDSASITAAKTYNITGDLVWQNQPTSFTAFQFIRELQENPYSGANDYVIGLYLVGAVFSGFQQGWLYSKTSSSGYPSVATSNGEIDELTFTGGTDITNTELISWLEANGTLTKPVITQLAPFLTSIANAIREKKGTTDPINAQDFASEIASISTGGGTGGDNV